MIGFRDYSNKKTVKAGRNISKGLVVTAVLLIIVVAWLGFLTFSMHGGITGFAVNNEQWRCTLVNCTRFISGYEWAQQNCFLAGNQTACRINVDGVDQLIPLEYLNLSAFQQCVEYDCIEETRVRSVNYNYNTAG